MSSSKSSSNKPKGKNALSGMLAERTSFDEEIARSLQFIEDFDIKDKNITDEEAREYMKHVNNIRNEQIRQKHLMKNIQNTKSNYRRNRRHRRQSLPTFTPPSAVAAPAPVAAAAPVAAPAPAPTSKTSVDCVICFNSTVKYMSCVRCKECKICLNCYDKLVENKNHRYGSRFISKCPTCNLECNKCRRREKHEICSWSLREGHIIDVEYSNEGDKYTVEERKIWEQQLKDSVLYKIDIPEDWVPSPIIKGKGLDNSSSYSLIRLDKTGELYNDIYSKYISTSGYKNSRDIIIFKVQNYEKLYEYIRNRAILSSKIGEENLNETTLYHGTRQEIDICSTGLDMRFAKGGQYGNGIYFADRSEISAGFSSRLITVNRVLLGKKYLSPTRYRYNIPPEGHNSVYAKRGDGHEYILYNNNYSYIDYVILDNNLESRDRGSSSLRMRRRNTGFSTRGGNNPGAAGFSTSYNSYNRPARSSQTNLHSYYSTQRQLPSARRLAIETKRKNTVVEKRLYYKKAKYNNAGEWKFPNVTGQIDWKIGSTDYEIHINTDGEDITAIIKYCERFNMDRHSLTPAEQRVSRTGNNNNAALQVSIDYKKMTILAYKNGIKIIEKAKKRALASKYNKGPGNRLGRRWSKNNLIDEIESRKSSSGGLKNKTWLYYSSSYKRYQLINILLIDDAIMASANKIINNCKNAITRLQRRCRNRIIKKKMDMIAVSNADDDDD